jgi:hypothetical protein
MAFHVALKERGRSPMYMALTATRRASRPLRNPYPTLIEPCIQG